MPSNASLPRDGPFLATDLHVEATYRLTEALVEAEARMRRRVELLSEVVFETDPAGTLVFLSRVWADVLGHSVADAIGRPLVAFVEPDDVAVVSARLATPSPERLQIRMRRHDGALCWMELSVGAIPGGGAVGVLHDITRQKHTQDELAKVSLVASYTDNMVIIADAAGRVEWVNRAFEERTGFALADLLGKKPGRFLQGPESSPAAIHAIRVALQRGEPIRTELMNYTKARQPYFVQLQINPIRDATGAVVQYISVQSDATERHRAEEALRALNQDLEWRVQSRATQLTQFKSALDEHALVTIVNPDGSISYVNDRMCSTSGYSHLEILGATHRLLNSGTHPTAYFATLWSTITAGQVWHGEICNRRRDGSLFWVDSTIVPFLNDDGVPEQYIAIQTDITERKEAEARIQQLNQAMQAGSDRLAEANRELESFAYSVSHDLRAPLRHIHGYLDMLRRVTAGQLEPKAQRYIQTVTDASIEMGQLIDDLLAFSRMGQAAMMQEAIDLHAVVQEVLAGLDTVVAGRNIQWTVETLPTVMGDRAMVRQVLTNLIGNAVKYTGRREVACITVGTAGMEDGRCVLFVRDNGAGFDMAYADKLFGVFQRLHRAEDFEGTGIGLAIVRRIIMRHGGRVWAEAAVDQGATFFFTLAPASHG